MHIFYEFVSELTVFLIPSFTMSYINFQTCRYRIFCVTILVINGLRVLSMQLDRPRESGIVIGVINTGTHNAITDVKGVKVGHSTIHMGDSIQTGVTAILPHEDNIFRQKVPAAIHIGNGFGKLAGYTQVEELGNIETPIILTNTLSVPTAADALIDYTLSQEGNEQVRSVNPIVGETNDGYLNDIQGRHVNKEHVLAAIQQAQSGPIAEGTVGAGTGTICFGFKGGIGTASRVLPRASGGYTVGALVQTNYGGVLTIDGVPVGEELGTYYLQRQLQSHSDGSCMIVIATDAPLDARNLKRLAKRAIMGLARTGGIASNGSGDYVIAFSTATSIRIPYQTDQTTQTNTFLRNDHMSPLFMATIEATEEAIINSLFASSEFESKGIKGLPIEKVRELMREYGRIE